MAMLESRGEHYVLINDKGDELILSDDEVMALAQSAEPMRAHVLAKYSDRGSIAARSTIKVAQIVLNSDVHQTAVILQMIDANGNKIGFAVPFSIAQPLSDLLAERISKMENAIATRKSH